MGDVKQAGAEFEGQFRVPQGNKICASGGDPQMGLGPSTSPCSEMDPCLGRTISEACSQPFWTLLGKHAASQNKTN